MNNDHAPAVERRMAVAIIGMAGRFPGASTTMQLWKNILHGKRAISKFDGEDQGSQEIELAIQHRSSHVPAGSILENYDRFDASFFGYTPREAEIMDPQHRLILECAWEALEDAGYVSERPNYLGGVFVGSAFSTYLLKNLYTDTKLLELIGEIGIAVGNDKDALASTISYKLNLKGPSVSVQTFCSTSLVGVHMACQSLLTFECDLALAGGVAVQVPQGCGYEYQEGGILSPDGHCRTFDARAGGSVMGSGVGLVVLKRLDEALQDGDQVYAVIRGSAVNNDGGVRAGYTAPSVDGQAGVIAEALAHAEVEAESIGYIEAHGTATPLGDAVELAAMIKAFKGKTEKKRYCAIGSIKPNVGHLDRAAGVTGLIKAVQALRYKQLPPQIDYEQPNPGVDLTDSPFYVNTTACDWPSVEGTPRRAGVSSFGLGGTNAHVVLEEAPEAEVSSPSRPWELLVLSAKTPAALEEVTKRLASQLADDTEANLGDVAYTLQVGRCAFNHRRIAVCRNAADAASVLSSGDPQRVFTVEQVGRGRPVVFMFPGLGDQYVGMGRELYQVEPAFRAAVDECSNIVMHHLGIDLREVLYPPEVPTDPLSKENYHLDLRSIIKSGDISQIPQPLFSTTVLPALFTVEYSLARLLMAWGIHPCGVLGYSLGEYVAATVAGVFSLEQGLKLCCDIARVLETAPPGAMLAVASSVERLKPLLQFGDLAATNADQLCVISGSPEEISRLEAVLQAQEIACNRLASSHAFHSATFACATAEITRLVSNLSCSAPTIPIFSSTEGGRLPTDRACNPLFWSRPIHDPVRFKEVANDLLADENIALAELGPGLALSCFLRQHTLWAPQRFVVSALPHKLTSREALASFLEAIGKLWLAGVNIEWSSHHSGFRKRRSLPTYPFDPQRHWLETKQGKWKFKSVLPDELRAPYKLEDVSAWTYQPAWIKSPLPLQVDWVRLVHKAPWLVVTGESFVGDELVTMLRGHGCQTVRVAGGLTYKRWSEWDFSLPLTKNEDWSRLFKELDNPPRVIVHLGGVTHDSSASIDTKLDNGFYSAIALAQVIEQQFHADDVELWLISANAIAVSRVEPVCPAGATLLGAARVIPQEILSIRCGYIDIVYETDIRRIPALNEQLLVELGKTPYEEPIALRDGERWLRRFEPLRMDKGIGKTAKLRPGGVYILTGGFGAVAGVVANYLAKTFQAKLVLLGRSVPPPRETWLGWLSDHPFDDSTSMQIRRVQELEELGAEVIFAAVDIANEEQMQAAFEQVREHFNVIHGIFHTAGSSAPEGFQTIRMTQRAGCEMHFRPKMRALYVLERLLANDRLDFVILFSSIAATLGGLGFVSYAGANIAMDAFVSARGRVGVTPWVTINWDTWRLRQPASGNGLGRTISELEMSPEEAIDILERVLNYLPPQVLVSTGSLEARYEQWVRMNSFESEEKKGLHARPELGTAYVLPRTDLEAKLCDIWQQVLGLERIGVHDDFLELGGHSLLATQLIARVRKVFRVDIPLLTLFDASTVSLFSEILERKLLEEIESLTEDEANSLVSGSPADIRPLES